MKTLREPSRHLLAALKPVAPDDATALAAIAHELAVELAGLSFAQSIPENEKNHDPETNDPTG